MIEKYESHQARSEHLKGEALAALRSALAGKLSSGLDVQVLVRTRPGMPGRARCDRTQVTINAIVVGTRKGTQIMSTNAVQLATVQDFANYWATGYDWRRREAKLNALPQFTTEIDGLGIHFIQVRSPHGNAHIACHASRDQGSLIRTTLAGPKL